MKKENPLWHSIYFEPLFTAICRAVATRTPRWSHLRSLRAGRCPG